MWIKTSLVALLMLAMASTAWAAGSDDPEPDRPPSDYDRAVTAIGGENSPRHFPFCRSS